MRLFVAVTPPAAALAELARAVAPLHAVAGADGLRWADPAGWHLTLVFLGEVPEERLPALRDGLARVAPGQQEHRVSLAGGGRFGDRVLWVGLAGQTRELRALAGAVARVAGEELGVTEESGYQPHLTLARAGTGRSHPPREQREALRAAAERLATFQGTPYPVTGFELMRSDFGRGNGPVRYTAIDRWELARPR
ncbi:RNA 2',3'-cyclic phosphodiesterase [Streptomyces tateyamensis]|uniref:RNA 2',3'-cyclic phosphodiesterase n=1 Tax=Streptomyces tateyamensis TaxID=565073 RepID=A0A2V4NV40_9ACTN|nr:RNA 2',3'-cyclic phosphodiesterase [Streptomyces tateyamensis]PYC85376.1 RNA 2',3'-cyclic phosphodiesterase [Streptomyces tateyamensis]